MNKVYVYVDESGTLPDPKDKVVVVAAVGTLSPDRLDSLFSKIRKNSVPKRPSGEVKFYTAGEKTKIAFFNQITREQIEIFTLVVDKQGRKVVDSPENFAILSWLLISEVLNFYPEEVEIVFDRHFTSLLQLKRFDQVLKALLLRPVEIRHVDSQTHRVINVADMIAGAVLANETGKISSYFTTIRGKIIVSLRVNWAEAKRRFFDKKRLAEPM